MKTRVVDWAAESRSLPGEFECGDKCVVTEVIGGVLVAVIDGLGHGGEAARAAECAVVSIKENANRSFTSLILQCHAAQRQTRGAVMSLALLDDNRSMTWMGIGNVEGRVIRNSIKHAEKSESLLLRTGMVGGEGNNLPAMYPTGVSLVRGDILVLTTDGIRNDFEAQINPASKPKVIAENIITHHRRLNDDALVFVGRYIG